jgi:hypothetical protein
MTPSLLRIALPAVLGLGLVAPACAQITKVGNAYSFRVKFAAGSVIKYNTVVNFSVGGAKQSFSTPMVQSVIGVHHDIADLLLKSGPLKVNGKPAGQQVVTRMSVDRQGQFLEGKDSGSSGITTFPLKPLRLGQTWKGRVPLVLGGLQGNSTSTVTTTYRFVRMTTYKNQKVAELALAFKTGGQFAITGAGTAFVLAKDGNMLHSAMKLHVALAANIDPIPVDAEVSRI